MVGSRKEGFGNACRFRRVLRAVSAPVAQRRADHIRQRAVNDGLEQFIFKFCVVTVDFGQQIGAVHDRLTRRRIQNGHLRIGEREGRFIIRCIGIASSMFRVTDGKRYIRAFGRVVHFERHHGFISKSRGIVNAVKVRRARNHTVVLVILIFDRVFQSGTVRRYDP